MKSVFVISIIVFVASALIIPDVVLANEKADKGPLTKKVFIHYKKPHAKPDGTGKPAKPPKDDQGSYTYISSGMKWKTTENYILNPTFAPAGASAAIETAMNTWDTEVNFSIFGTLSEDSGVSVNLDNVDNANVIVFAPLADSRIIAVTYVWGYFNAPPKFREIVEVDMIFNTDEWLVWGDAEADGIVMDLLNIATHEIGHAAGMGDLYDTTAQLETMYGYSGNGEIIKRDLYLGDIAGIRNLYK